MRNNVLRNILLPEMARDNASCFNEYIKQMCLSVINAIQREITSNGLQVYYFTSGNPLYKHTYRIIRTVHCSR